MKELRKYRLQVVEMVVGARFSIVQKCGCGDAPQPYALKWLIAKGPRFAKADLTT